MCLLELYYFYKWFYSGRPRIYMELISKNGRSENLPLMLWYNLHEANSMFYLEIALIDIFASKWMICSELPTQQHFTNIEFILAIKLYRSALEIETSHINVLILNSPTWTGKYRLL